MDLINREQALGCFWNYANDDGTGYDETEMPAYDRLQALPIVAEVEDCISRQAAIDAVRKSYDEILDFSSDGHTIADSVEDIINMVPSAQPDERMLHESCTDCPLYDKDRHRCPRFNKVIPETLREVQSEQRWIPRSKKLPEPNRSVLVQLSDDFVDPIQIMTLNISKCEGDFFWSWRTQEMGIDFDMDDVVAWMPLPEPYKGGEQDELRS